MILFAQAALAEAKPVPPPPPPKRNELNRLEDAVPMLLLVVAILAFALLVFWFRRSLRGKEEELSASELLTQAREWEEEGELTEAEYAKLKANLAPSLRLSRAARNNKGDPARRPPPQNP